MPAINLFQIFLFLFLWSVGLSLAQTDHFLVETSNTTQNYDASEVVGKSPVSTELYFSLQKLKEWALTYEHTSYIVANYSDERLWCRNSLC